ncbi:MAG: CD225/dispanin family protein [Bacteroidaceae bacterium]|nr:CD225/dispanin family protein [Bacteroidaceae bacterium]
MRICPKCGFQIENDNALFCRKCGTKLPQIETDETLEAPDYSQDTPQYSQDTPQYGQDDAEYSQNANEYSQSGDNGFDQENNGYNQEDYAHTQDNNGYSQNDATNNQGSATNYNQETNDYGTSQYSVEEGDMKMAEFTGSSDVHNVGVGDDDTRFYDEDDGMAVPPPPPPLPFGYGNAGNNSSAYTQQNYQPEYTQQNYNDVKPKKPDNHLLKAILSTFLCVHILGVVAIVYAVQVDSSYDQGLYDEAENKARKANSWANASIAIGLIIYFIALIFIVVAAIAGNSY